MRPFLLLLVCIITGCTEIETLPEFDAVDLPDLELFDAEVRISRASNTIFTVKAQHISKIEKLDVLILDGGVQVDFFDSEGGHTATMTSRQGEVLNREKLMKAIGNVVVKSDSGMVLLTEELYFDQESERVLSDQFVTIITDTDSLSGYGFSAAPNLEDWVIKNTSGTTWRRMESQSEK